MNHAVPRVLRAMVWAYAIVVGALVSSGCGTGSNAATAADASVASQQSNAARGSLQFRLVFPTAKRSANSSARTRGPDGFDGSIPLGSHSVKITVTNAATGALVTPARIVNDSARPDGVTGTIIVGFPLLPVGPVKIDITAHPDRTASGNPLATGTGTATIAANDTAIAAILMQLTIKTFTVSPPRQTLSARQQPFQSGMVDAQALDAQGRPLLYPIEYSIDNPGVAQITAVSADFMHATITPLQTPETQVTVLVTATEPNSGMTGTVRVVITSR